MFSSERKRNEEGLVYRGAADLVHIEDGKRAQTGAMLARMLAAEMRNAAVANGSRTSLQAHGDVLTPALPLCPGCYMVALFNAAVTLAKANGQSLSELGNSMANAFRSLAEGGADRMESIAVALDAEG